jgi:hypothetical protein
MSSTMSTALSTLLSRVSYNVLYLSNDKEPKLSMLRLIQLTGDFKSHVIDTD